jgi:hypothetical protein
MRTCSKLIFAAALSLAALGCKKEDKGASTDKKEPAAAKSGGGEMKSPDGDKPEPAVAEGDKAPAKDPEPAPTAAPTDGDSITLTSVPPAVGDKWTEEKTQTMQLDISAQGQKVPMVGGEHEVKAIEVLAVTGDIVTKEKVTYTTLEHSQKLAGQEKLQPPVIAGKTYTIEAGDTLAVTTDAGPAAEAEAKEVQDAEKNFGKPEKFGKLLEGKTFKKDETVDFPADQIADAMGDADNMKVTKLSMTYRGMEGEVAMFDMAMTIVQETPGGTLTMDMAGKAKVDPKTNEPVDMALDGKLAMTGKAEATGTMTMHESRSK